MFWRVQGEEQASPLEKILDKDSFTLEELLLEEDIIQEVKAMNDRLVDYLKQPETVWQLSKYVVEPFEAVKKLEEELQRKNERERLEEEAKDSKSEDSDGQVIFGGEEGDEEEEEEAKGDDDSTTSTATTEAAGNEKGESGTAEGGSKGVEEATDEDSQQVQSASASTVEGTQEGAVKMSEEELRHYAFQSAQRVCEIFCCEVDEMFTTLVSSISTDSDDEEKEQKQEEGGPDYDYLGYLFSFLDQAKPLDSVLAGYFSRLMISIAQRRPDEISTYFQENPGILFKLMDHLDSYSITEFVLRLISGDEQNALYQKEQGNEWLVKTDLLKLLVEKATTGSTATRSKGEGTGGEEERLLFNTVTNAVSCVVGIANTAPSAIASQLQDPQVIARLLSTIDKETPSHVLIATIDVFIAILQPRQAKQALSPDVMMSYGAFGSPVAVEETIDASMIDCAGLIMEKMNDLCGMLEANEEEQGFETSYGKVPSRLGMRRYKILDLIGKVVNIVDAEKCLRITQKTEIIPITFALMYQMPFNSMLHNVIQNIVFGLLCTENKEVILSLIDNCKLHKLVSSARPVIHNGDSEMELHKVDKPLRAGYFGVVTSIANQILQCATTDTEIEKKLEDDQQWTTWVVDVLVVQNKLEDPTSWECGRPSRVNDILGDMGGSSAVDLSLYSGFSMGASSNDNDRYDNDNDNDTYDFDLEDDEDDEDVYDTVDVVTSFQGLSTGESDDQQTLEDSVVLVSSPEDLDSKTDNKGAEADMKLIEEKQKIKRADTPAITGGNAAGADAKFNSANFWRSSYTFDITDEES